MRSYKVARFGEALECIEVPTPMPSAAQVLVRIGSCGVCHSDLHIQDGFFDLGEGKTLDVSRGVAPPRTPGHEIAGTVVAVGPEVRGVAPGHRAVVFPWIGCGDCSLCHAGDEHLCNRSQTLGINRDGGFADHVMVPHERYLVDYGTLAEEQACTLACSGLTAYSAIAKAQPLDRNDPVLVIGAGGVGLSGIRLLRELHGISPIVAELDRRKWSAAEAAGAARVIDSTDADALKELVRATRGGVAAAFDFVGAGSSLGFAISTVRKAGRVIAVGMLGGSVPVAPALLAMKAISIVGSCVGSLAELNALMGLARDGRLPDMPVSLVPLDDVNATMAQLRSGHIVGRAILKPTIVV